MKSKMTTQELSTLMIDKITFITTDPKGRETTWRTSPDVDHSSLCDGWDVEEWSTLGDVVHFFSLPCLSVVIKVILSIIKVDNS